MNLLPIIGVLGLGFIAYQVFQQVDGVNGVQAAEAEPDEQDAFVSEDEQDWAQVYPGFTPLPQVIFEPNWQAGYGTYGGEE